MSCLHNVVKTLPSTGIGLCVQCGAQVFEQDGKWFLEKDWPKANDKDYPSEFKKRLKAITEIEAMQVPKECDTPVLIAQELFHRIREVETILFLRLNAAIDSGDETVVALCREIQEVLK